MGEEEVKEIVLRKLMEKDNLDKLLRIIENLDALEAFIDKLAWMRENGILDGLANLMGELVIAQRGLVNEEMVKLMAEAATLATPYMQPECIEEVRKAYSEDEKIGLFGLIGGLRDPDVQRGLAVAVNILKALGRCVKYHQSSGLG